MSTNTIFDLSKLYKTYFNNSPYFIANKDSQQPLTQDIGYSIFAKNPNPKGFIHRSKNDQPFNKIGAYGQDIWFPVTLKTIIIENGKPEAITIEIEACTVAVRLAKTIVRTAVSERQGTVKECFNTDDYKFTIKGFLIGKNRTVPEDQIISLKKIFETAKPVELHGGYPEMFLEKSCRIAIDTLEFPEVQGKAPWIRPFTLTCESDYIEGLEIKDI